MKILMAFNRDLNPYVNVLAAGLAAAGCPVDMGTEKFWAAGRFDHDIVHIQWPETLFDWRVPSSIEMQFLRRRLREIHTKAKIVFTRHNDVSHHVNDQNEEILKELYMLIESECDVMIHLGEASRRACLAQPGLAGKHHAMIPIPVYDELYAPYIDMNRVGARRILGIPKDQKAVLAFGNFRFEKEKQLVISACSSLREQRAFLIAPKWHKEFEYAFCLRHPMLTLRTAQKAIWAWRNRMILGVDAKRIMSDEEVARYFSAVDVVFIQRLNELNSGNLPMAFLFKKVVVGPDCGNIGEWLRATGNPVFDAHKPNSAKAALNRALELTKSNLGEANFKFSIENWSTRRIGQSHLDLYKSFLNI